MTPFAAALLAVLLSTLGEPRLPVQPNVHVRIDQDYGLTHANLQAAIGEVREIWRSGGVAVTTGRYGDPVPQGATVVSLRLVGARASDQAGQPVLAWVNIRSLSEAVPMTFVSVPAVRELLSAANYRGKPLAQRPQALRDHFVARAIGRAVAHELGHYLLGRRHDRAGLMRPHYSTEDLMNESNESFRIR